MKQLFAKTILIKFAEADPQGFLYFARTAEIAHEALEEFWQSQPQGWKFWFQNPEFAVPIRHSSSDFQRPIKAGETYRVVVEVQKLGESSVEIVTDFFSTETSASLCARVTNTHVFVDRQKLKKIEIPAAVRAALTV